MSIIVNENNYRYIRNNDPLYQSMIRISDTNNTSDIVQEYIKSGNSRNDFRKQIDLFDNNSGILNDGKHIDMSKFFIETSLVNGKLVGKSIPYFKFKTNRVLNFRDSSHIKDTYIDKTKLENIYDIEITTDSTTGKEIYNIKDDKKLTENVYNSYPLQRIDKLTLYELDSLFIYVNGKKIPDNEVFVYTNKSFTDIFIPEKYIPGNIHDNKSFIDVTFHIDYRQPGSESLYFRKNISGKTFEVDLNNSSYGYNAKKIPSNISKDKLLVFVNGFNKKIENCSIENGVISVEMVNEMVNGDVEFYIMNDVVYRYKVPEVSMKNSSGSKLHFYLNDDYVTDTLSGPLTKNAVSFFYKGERINDKYITQTSRFSFEYEIQPFYYRQLTEYNKPMPNTIYYTKDMNNSYIPVGSLTHFNSNTIYYVKERTPDFDENEIDFFIEDIGHIVDDKNFKIYGDDYYLLNMLGVKRCVDKMKGTYSYSIFDQERFDVDFKETLSKNGALFDVNEAIDKYIQIDRTINTPKERIKQLIRERPTLIRKLLEQFKKPSKKLKVLGNQKDVIISSVTQLNSVDDEVYYKIYVNHVLLDSTDYTIKRDGLFDMITISKEVLEPLEGNAVTGFTRGVNEIEMYQYDLTYKSKTIYKDNVNSEGFTVLYASDGTPIYEKTYNISDLPFDPELVIDDICAIEQIQQRWFHSYEKEYDYFYCNDEKIGYRMVKSFEVVEKNDSIMKIRIQLHKNTPETTKGEFFLMSKQYNVVEKINFDNSDGTYMEENDLLIPVYTNYVEYGYDSLGNRIIKNVYNYIPYINNSEPFISIDGKEAIFGADYTFVNPEKKGIITTSYIIFKNQPADNSIINIQFNSSKTNILIVGYDDLEVTNRYGLLYLSELPYPISSDYMNIFINGEKVSSYDMDILSDKLVRFHHISRPIRSVLITTNSLYKDSEMSEFISLYKESDFEKTLENIFWNCDPSKTNDANRPNIDFIYKMNPYYSEFVGENYQDNSYYDEYVETIMTNKNSYNKYSVFESIFLKPKDTENDYEMKIDAWNKAKLFFDNYKSNHGFIEDVDSVKQKENPYSHVTTDNFITDTLEVMYMNWLAKSGKTRTFGFKDENIDSKVLNYFSIYENVIINDRIDIVVDGGRYYDGMQPDVNNPIYETDPITGEERVSYVGADMNLKRRMFYEMLLQELEKRNAQNEQIVQRDPETGVDYLLRDICNNKVSNLLYPDDFPLKPDDDGIKWTGTQVDIVNNNDYMYKAIVKYKLSQDSDEIMEEPIMLSSNRQLTDAIIAGYIATHPNYYDIQITN